MDNRPIGFLDSGVGGLTVVRELKRQLPHESIVYIGDSARAPYGPRPAEQIRHWFNTNLITNRLICFIDSSSLGGNQRSLGYPSARCGFAWF